MEDVPIEQDDAKQKKRPRSSFLASWLRLGERSTEEKKPFSGRAWNSFENFFGSTVKPPETLATATEAAQGFEVLDSEPEDDTEFVQPNEGGELLISHEEQAPRTGDGYPSGDTLEPPREVPTTNPFEEFEAQVQREQRRSIHPEEEIQADAPGEIDFERRHEVKDEPGSSQQQPAPETPASTGAAYQAEAQKAADIFPIYEPPAAATIQSPQEPPDNSQTMYGQAVRRGFWAGILVLSILWLIYLVR